MGTITDIFSLLDADSALEVFMFFVKYGLLIGFMLTTGLDLLAYGVYKALSLLNTINH